MKFIKRYYIEKDLCYLMYQKFDYKKNEIINEEDKIEIQDLDKNITGIEFIQKNDTKSSLANLELQIIKEIEAGVEPQNFSKYTSIPDRKEAIKMAIKFAEPKDIVLVAGKGHETYQEINGVRHHFDDKEVIKELLTLMGK